MYFNLYFILNIKRKKNIKNHTVIFVKIYVQIWEIKNLLNYFNFFFHYNNNRLLIKKVEIYIYIYLHSANVNILVSKKIIKYYTRIIIKNYKIYHIGYNIMQSIFFKMIEIVKKFDLFVSLSRIIWSFSVSNSIFFFFFFFLYFLLFYL